MSWAVAVAIFATFSLARSDNNDALHRINLSKDRKMKSEEDAEMMKLLEKA